MFPPPPVKPPDTSAALQGNDFDTVRRFYTALFGAIGISALETDTVEDGETITTVSFGDRLHIRNVSPATQNAQVVIYTLKPEDVDRAVEAVRGIHNDVIVEPDDVTDDGVRRHFAKVKDPDGNVVWIVCDSA